MGKLFVVGIGPGEPDLLAPIALRRLEESEIIVGYEKYVDQIKKILPEKTFLPFRMGEELKRCKTALELSRKHTVSLVSSGDPGIYGMASLVLEMANDEEVEIIPGIPALSFCAAKIGAPLGADFALISLSDLITPWEVIAFNLDRVASADMPIVLINPGSSKRKLHLSKAAHIIYRYRASETPVGIVENAFSESERLTITTLGNLLGKPFENMNATVFIGTQRTCIKNKAIITDRGYFRSWGIPLKNLEADGIPENIEKKSLDFIRDNLRNSMDFNEFELEVVSRMIHACADFSIASLVRFHPEFEKNIIQAVRQRKTIIADTEMAAAGFNKKLTKKLGLKVKVIPKIKVSSETALSAGLQSIKSEIPNSVIIIGNAPSVLRKLISIHRETKILPAAVIATPVGFVDAAQAKEELIKTPIPYLTILGNKGGTPLAVSAFNAILKIIDAKQLK